MSWKHLNRKSRCEHERDITELIFLPQEDEQYEMPTDHKQDSAKSYSFCSPLWPPSHRWHSRAQPSPTQTPSVASLFSATVQNRLRNAYHWDKLTFNMAECLRFAGQWVFEEMLVLVWDVFQGNWHFPTLLHQLVSQSPALELWLSGSSNKKRKKNDNNEIVMNNNIKCVHGAMIIAPQWFDKKSWCGFLIKLNTYFSTLSLWYLQLHPPARLLLFHAALKALQDALLWTPQECQVSSAILYHTATIYATQNTQSHRLSQNLLICLTVLL